MEIVNCPSCAKKTINDDPTCQHCGAVLGAGTSELSPSEGASVTADGAPELAAPAVESRDNSFTGKKRVISIGAAALAFILIFMIILMMTSGNESMTGVLDLGHVSNSGHACVVLENGVAACWGSNEYSETGTAPTEVRQYPVVVSWISKAKSIACGRHHACALLQDGTAKCWGSNRAPSSLPVNPSELSEMPYSKIPLFVSSGQLGNGETDDGFIEDSATPVLVKGVGDIVDIAAGGYHSCAVLSDGSARCWGWNAHMDSEYNIERAGQLGHGADDNQENEGFTPVVVKGLSNAKAIGAGIAHTCALLRDGKVMCWGLNSRGQVGDGTTENRLAPVLVPGLEKVESLSVGSTHACASTNGGYVHCWGSNRSNEVTGSENFYRTPTKVEKVSDVAAVSAGRRHSCALHDNGTVSCWGSNSSGEIGNGKTSTYEEPQKVSDLHDAVSVSAGANRSCALLSDGTIRCWGANGSGELGDGRSTEQQTTPVGVCKAGTWNGSECSGGSLFSILMD